MKEEQVLVSNFNQEWAKKVTKKQFVKQHAHLGDEKFLENEYDKIVPPKQALQAELPKEEVKKNSEG